MKKLSLLLCCIAFVLQSCSSDDEKDDLVGVANTWFENFKRISDNEFELSSDLDINMFFSSVNCVDSADFVVSNTFNTERNDVFTYYVDSSTVFTVTKIAPAAFNIEFSDSAHLYNEGCHYFLNFYNNHPQVYLYSFHYDGERWCWTDEEEVMDKMNELKKILLSNN